MQASTACRLGVTELKVESRQAWLAKKRQENPKRAVGGLRARRCELLLLTLKDDLCPPCMLSLFVPFSTLRVGVHARPMRQHATSDSDMI